MNYEEQIDEILKILLNLEEIAPDIGVVNCGAWDSLVQISLVSILEDNFKIKIESQDIPKLMSRDGILSYLLESK
jgi:acyl carrier protein